MTTPRPTTGRGRAGAGWIVLLGALCAGLVGYDVVRHPHGHFPFESWPGIYGAIGCAASLVLMTVAKAVRPLLRRKVSYYGDE